MNTSRGSLSTRVRQWVAVLSVAGVSALALVVASATTAGAVTARLPVSVVGSGSDVTFHVMSALDQLYNESPGCNTIAPSGTQPEDYSCIPQTGDITTENYDHDRVSEAFPIGGSAGEDQLCKQGLPNEGVEDFARQTSISDKCTGLRWVAYARDGVTWESWPNVSGAGSHGVTSLTLTQLYDIYVACKGPNGITNWNQVGGANVPIVPYTILPQYGTRKFFDTLIGGDSSTCAVHQIDQTNNSEVAAADQPGAIVPVSIGSWTERYTSTKTKDGSVLGGENGVAPTIANLQNLTFPGGRYLYNVYCAGDPANSNKCGTDSPSNAATLSYVGPNGWICKATHATDPTTAVKYRTEIQQAITKYGFANLTKGATGGGTTYTNFCRQFTG